MKNTAIILAGALAKGAFESGALSVLVKNPELNIRTIVATSSGALNATALAAGITSGKVEQAMDALVSTWINHGSWYNILEFSLSKIINRQGLASSDRLRRLIKITVEKFVTSKLHPIELKIVLTQLSGHTGFIDGRPSTTFEAVANFSQQDFYNLKMRESIYTAACASAAFPGLFAPVDVPGFGACYDGGLVNDTPIKYAIESQHIERIIVISPFPAISASPDNFKGLDLASRFSDVIVNERLYRDLLNADKVNQIISKLNQLRTSKGISDEQFKKIKAVLDFKREIEIIQIRPKKRLEGNGFSGLFNKHLRESYIQEGIKTAQGLVL
jgi:NTE family protein